MAAARFEVFGRVQGVGFRFFAQRQAQTLRLRGWVRNRDDTAVEVYAEGSEHALDEFERELRRGPATASVSRLVRRPAETSSLSDFQIRI
ncbi:MAG: acylphosphatase [Terriglobales bacterium]